MEKWADRQRRRRKGRQLDKGERQRDQGMNEKTDRWKERWTGRQMDRQTRREGEKRWRKRLNKDEAGCLQGPRAPSPRRGGISQAWRGFQTPVSPSSQVSLRPPFSSGSGVQRHGLLGSEGWGHWGQLVAGQDMKKAKKGTEMWGPMEQGMKGARGQVLGRGGLWMQLLVRHEVGHWGARASAQAL